MRHRRKKARLWPILAVLAIFVIFGVRWYNDRTLKQDYISSDEPAASISRYQQVPKTAEPEFELPDGPLLSSQPAVKPGGNQGGNGPGSAEPSPGGAFSSAWLAQNYPTEDALEKAKLRASDAAKPYEKEGFLLREDYWGGDMAEGDREVIAHQLFKGNEYWFFVGTGTNGSTVTVHVYDADGKLVDSDKWTKESVSAVKFSPPKTGTYYLVVTVDKAQEERTSWALIYGYR